MSNDELTKKLHAIHNGDHTAFDEVYKDLQIPIFTIIYRITWDNALAEEITQEVFIKIYLSSFNQPARNIRAYIFQMARNLAIDSIRKRKTSENLEIAENRFYQPVETLSQRLDIENALRALPDRERQIIILHINAGLRFREIANVIKQPLGTVIWAYQKAIKYLRIALGGEA